MYIKYISKVQLNPKRTFKDKFYINSIFIMLIFILNASFGFIFWIIAVRVYPKEDVGIATALISSMGLLILFSRLGLDFSIIRFFPKNDKSVILSTSTIVTTFFAAVLGIIFVVGVDFWSPKLSVLKSENALYYIFFVSAYSIVSITNSSLIAMRKAAFNFLQSTIVGVRILFLLPFMFLGAMGIFFAFGLSFLLAAIATFFFLKWSGIEITLKLDRDFLNDAFAFSTSNYFIGILMTTPNLILPIMVLNIMGAEKSAYYYIASSITSILFIIPNATSTSLFVEGSHGEALRITTIKSLLAAYIFLIPSILFIYFCGDWLLSIINKDYLEGFELLKVLALSGLTIPIIYNYFSIKRIQKDIKGSLLLSGVIFTLVIGLSYISIITFGLIGIGYAWFIGYSVGVLIIGIIAFAEGWFSFNFSDILLAILRK